MNPKYDRIGTTYSTTRQTDPKIAKQLYSELKGASKIINIGAGTGSYEPQDIDLVALEPSLKMIEQRPKIAPPVVQAIAEKLPFEDHSFSHAMTVLSMHHWENQALAFQEINRVTKEKFVAISWNPAAAPFWLTRDYFPEIHEMDIAIFPGLAELVTHFDEVSIQPLLIPEDCQDGFLAAFWKRPEAYLNRQVRNSMSSFSKLNKLEEGLSKLEADLASGAWHEKNKEILEMDALDVRYCLITAKVKKLY